jgi:hypothetical protein
VDGYGGSLRAEQTHLATLTNVRIWERKKKERRTEKEGEKKDEIEGGGGTYGNVGITRPRDRSEEGQVLAFQ